MNIHRIIMKVDGERYRENTIGYYKHFSKARKKWLEFTAHQMVEAKKDVDNVTDWGVTQYIIDTMAIDEEE